MKSPVLFWAVLLLCISIAGCADTEIPSKADLEGSTYTGVIPCADCEGIAYRLTFKKDNRFETSSVYIGKSNRAFIERGNWNLKGDSLLFLNPSQENPRQFKLKNEQLVMLDQEGKEVSGSLAKMYVLNEADTAATDHRWEERRKKGIDFRAAGNEPSWKLDVDFDKMMVFSTLGSDSITAPVPKMQQDSATGARRWDAETESGSLEVEVLPTGCVDDMSGEVFNYMIHVAHKNKSYSGCGSFINTTYKLNNFWQLHAINGSEIVSEENAREIPSLHFDVAQNKVSGSTGCNRLNGSFELKENQLSFSKIATTRMACQDDMESRFLDALQKVTQYEITNAELSLMNESDTLMVFRRAE